jgi:hypothetical protein
MKLWMSFRSISCRFKGSFDRDPTLVCEETETEAKGEAYLDSGSSVSENCNSSLLKLLDSSSTGAGDATAFAAKPRDAIAAGDPTLSFSL